jgi:hypothetical protein
MLVSVGSQIWGADLKNGLKRKIKTTEIPKSIIHAPERLAFARGDSREFNGQPYEQDPPVSVPISYGGCFASLNSLAL